MRMFSSPIFILLFALVRLSSAATPTCASACPSLPRPLPFPTDLPVIPALPDPWTFFDGTTVKTTNDWSCRRAELLLLVQEYMYGYYPDHSLETVTATRSGDDLTVTVKQGNNTASFPAVIAFPNNTVASTNNKVPVLISAEPGLTYPGVAVVSFNVGDVAADSPNASGPFWDLYSGRDIGVLTAWGWGFHRILDAIELAVPEIDHTRVGAIGCSRDGKAALAAGIFDERITLTLAMSSGAEGIAPWRYQFQEFGENEKITNITGGFPYWSNTNLHNFVNNTGQIPFDAHLNAALVAPRALIWDEGELDYWTNPEGEARVTYIATHALYKWLGVGDQVGVAIRNSSHCDPTGYTNVEAFLEKSFFNTPTTRNYSDISPYALYPDAYPWLNDAPGQHSGRPGKRFSEGVGRFKGRV